MIDKHKKILILIVLVFMSIPNLFLLGVGVDKKITYPELPTLISTALLDGSFQKGFEKWHKERIFAKSDVNKICNQVYYWANLGQFFYNKEFKLGENGYLFGNLEIKNYYSVNKLDLEKLEILKQKLAYIKEYTNKKNIPILFVLGSSKVRLYNEYIPKESKYFYANNKISTPYQEWEKMLDSIDFPYLNTMEIAYQLKDKVQVYAKTGYHWGTYMNAYIAKTIAEKFNLDKVDILGIRDKYKSYLGERDIIEALKLIFPIRIFEKYENINITQANKQYNIAILGDSYANGLSSYFKRYNLKKDSRHLWFSNIKLSDKDIEKIFTESQYIIIIGTEANLINDEYSPQTMINSIYDWLVKHEKLKEI